MDNLGTVDGDLVILVQDDFQMFALQRLVLRLAVRKVLVVKHIIIDLMLQDLGKVVLGCRVVEVGLFCIAQTFKYVTGHKDRVTIRTLQFSIDIGSGD